MSTVSLRAARRSKGQKEHVASLLLERCRDVCNRWGLEEHPTIPCSRGETVPSGPFPCHRTSRSGTVTEKNKAALNVGGRLEMPPAHAGDLRSPHCLEELSHAELKEMSPLGSYGGVHYPWGRKATGLNQCLAGLSTLLLPNLQLSLSAASFCSHHLGSPQGEGHGPEATSSSET